MLLKRRWTKQYLLAVFLAMWNRLLWNRHLHRGVIAWPISSLNNEFCLTRSSGRDYYG
jgi:hypothetical protein